MFSYQETVHQVITDQPPETEESAERLRQIAADIYQQIAPLLARRENFALNLIFDKFRFTDRYTKEDFLLVYLGIIVSYFNFLAISGMENLVLSPNIRFHLMKFFQLPMEVTVSCLGCIKLGGGLD